MRLGTRIPILHLALVPISCTIPFSRSVNMSLRSIHTERFRYGKSNVDGAAPLIFTTRIQIQLQDTDNKWAVCILLECTLVFNHISRPDFLSPQILPATSRLSDNLVKPRVSVSLRIKRVGAEHLGSPFGCGAGFLGVREERSTHGACQ